MLKITTRDLRKLPEIKTKKNRKRERKRSGIFYITHIQHHFRKTYKMGMFSKIGQFSFDYKDIQNTSKRLGMISLIKSMCQIKQLFD